jgi:hypothetical protein
MKKVPIYNTKKCTEKDGKVTGCEEKTISVTRSSSVSDTVLMMTTCLKEGGCGTKVTVGGKHLKHKFPKGTLLCLTKVEMAFGMCNTCCCKGGMIQLKNAATLLHQTPGYGCARVHNMMDWASSTALSGFRVKKTLEVLGMNRRLISGNGCLD